MPMHGNKKELSTGLEGINLGRATAILTLIFENGAERK